MNHIVQPTIVTPGRGPLVRPAFIPPTVVQKRKLNEGGSEVDRDADKELPEEVKPKKKKKKTNAYKHYHLCYFRRYQNRE